MFDFAVMKQTAEYIAGQINKGQEPGPELVSMTRMIEQLTDEHKTLLLRPSEKD